MTIGLHPISYKKILTAKEIYRKIKPDDFNGKRQRLRKRTMILATWNVQGIRSKWIDVMKEIESMKVDLIVLTETKKKGSGMEKTGNYIHLYSGIPKEERAKRGVSILINKKFAKCLKNYETVDERILKANMNIYGKRFTILGIYAPNNDEREEIKDKFYEKLQEVTDEIGGTREIILLGDFNGRTGSKVNDNIVGQFGEDIVNNNGERLIEFCKTNDLKIGNGFYKHKDIHKFTWIQHTRQLKTIIDYIIVKQKTQLKLLDVRVQRGPECGSDHYMVGGKLAVPYSANIIREEKEYIEMDKIDAPKFNLDLLTDESTKRLFQMRLDEKLMEKDFDSTTELYLHIKSSLLQAANEALGQKEAKNNQRKTFWWDEDIEKVIQQKKEAYLKWMVSKNEEDRQKYRDLRKISKKLVLNKKRTSWDKKCREIETYIGGRKCTEAWKFLKNIRNECKNTWQGISAEKWENHYKNLLTETRKEFKDYIEDESLVEPILLDVETVKKASKNLKNHRASGPGGIPAEIIKNGTDKLFTLITQLLEKCLNGQETPEEWKVGYLTSIHKKGDRQKCENYRGITVTATFSRLYGRIIRDLIEKEYEMNESEEQSGFRAGRSCMDNIFCLKQILEKEMAVGNQIHLLFIDLSKAYDNVPITKLWTVLKEVNISHTLIRAIQGLYTNSKTKIKIGQTTSKGFTVNKGLRQGCCISPTLFKIYVEGALRIWKEKCRGMGLNLNGTSLFTLQFADDQVLISSSKENLQEMTTTIIREYEKWGLYMNLDKTKYLCVGGIEADLHLGNNRKIDSCEQYKYLGVIINREGRDSDEIKNRLSQGKKAVKVLNGIWWSEEISRGTKYNIYNTIVKSILLYGAEGWRIMQSEKKKLAAVEMDALRRSCRISRTERVRNERITQLMNMERTILDDLQKKQLIWYGHVKRMNNKRLPKVTFQYKPSKKRKRGRPRKSWHEDIKKAIKDRKLEEEWALDRQKWRKLL